MQVLEAGILTGLWLHCMQLFGVRMMAELDWWSMCKWCDLCNLVKLEYEACATWWTWMLPVQFLWSQNDEAYATLWNKNDEVCDCTVSKFVKLESWSQCNLFELEWWNLWNCVALEWWNMWLCWMQLYEVRIMKPVQLCGVGIVKPLPHYGVTVMKYVTALYATFCDCVNL